VSLDSGLFFEREGSWGSRPYIQTLEPRLYYLYVPHRDQDNLIVDENGNSVVFDTSEYDFSFAQLFREDRFTGADRVGDANQITAALTTRVLESGSSRERFRASVGQIYYFRDRDVILPNRVRGQSSTSDFVAEIFARFTNELSAGGAYQYDTDDDETERSTAFMRYQADRKIVNLTYRFRRDFLEQSDMSFVWPLNRRLSAVGRWNYSIDRSRTIDGYAGLEYENCCYIVRGIARQYLNDLDGDENNAILLQLELKGLTSLGDRVKDFLGKGILGYDRNK
jgi:LPS-assembly protein